MTILCKIDRHNLSVDDLYRRIPRHRHFVRRKPRNQRPAHEKDLTPLQTHHLRQVHNP